MSSLARAHSSGSCFSVKHLKFIFSWDVAAVHIIGVLVITGCLQGESELYMQRVVHVPSGRIFLAE